MPPHVIVTRAAESPLSCIVPPVPLKNWLCKMTLRVPGVGKSGPLLRVFQATLCAIVVVPRKKTRSTAPIGERMASVSFGPRALAAVGGTLVEGR